MNKLLMVMATLSVLTLMSACTNKETITLNDQTGRISDLERRMKLNEELDAAQTQLIQANSDAIALESQTRSDGDAYLLSLIQQEQNARAAGDQAQADALASSISQQLAINEALESLIDQLTFSVNSNTATIAMVQSQLNNLSFDLNVVENNINIINDTLSSTDLRVTALENGQLSLSNQLQSLQTQMNQEGVTVYKCNGVGSTERILKINNTFYGVMNRVQTEQIQVITGSSSVSFANPVLCLKDDKVKLPSGNGECPSSWTSVGGETINVPSYSTANKTVVTSVQIALDPLSNGTYSTTDGGPACTFSVNGGSSTNLVQVQ